MTMLMIETGRELFVDGKIASEPTSPFIVMSRGYCKISMFVTTADLIIIVPSDMDSDNLTNKVIGKLSNAMAFIEEKIADCHQRWTDDSRFNATLLKYTPVPSCIETFESSHPQRFRGKIIVSPNSIEKRVFSLGSNSRKAAFKWNVRIGFNVGKFVGLQGWISNKTAICIDLASRNPQFEEIEWPRSIVDVLHVHGVADSRIQFAKIVNMSADPAHDNPRWLLLRPDQSCDRLRNSISTVANVSPIHVLIKSTARFGNMIFVARQIDTKISEGARLPAATIVEFDNVGQCQVCKSLLWGLSFAIEWDDHAMSGICGYCLLSHKVFPILSAVNPIYQFTHPRKFCEVAAQYNLDAKCADALLQPKMRIQSDADSPILIVDDTTISLSYKVDMLINNKDDHWIVIKK